MGSNFCVYMTPLHAHVPLWYSEVSNVRVCIGALHTYIPLWQSSHVFHFQILVKLLLWEHYGLVLAILRRKNNWVLLYKGRDCCWNGTYEILWLLNQRAGTLGDC